MHDLSRHRALEHALSETVAAEDVKLSVVKGMCIKTETTFVQSGRLSFDPRKLGAGRRANQSECRTPHKQDTTLACGSWLGLRFSGIASSALRVVSHTMKFLRDRSSGEHLPMEAQTRRNFTTDSNQEQVPSYDLARTISLTARPKSQSKCFQVILVMGG